MHFLDQTINGIVTVLFSGMVVIIILLVLLRYGFGTTITGGYEILRFSFIYTTFLGAAVLLGHKGHIGMEIVVKRMPDWCRRTIDIVGHLLIFGFHIYLIVLSIRWISSTGGIPSTELRVPMKFIQISLPIGCSLAALYSVNIIIEDILGATNKVNS